MKCAVCQDDGLTLAHTIAHELGHMLNFEHDDLEDDLNNLESEKRYVMAPKMETDVRRLQWSSSSKEQLK